MAVRRLLLLCIMCWASTAHSQNYVYTSRTDTTAAPETVPLICTPAPCTMTSSDLNPNVLYTRLTDANYPLVNRQYGTIDAIVNEWEMNSNEFLVLNTNGSWIPYTLNQSTQAVSTIACTYAGGDCGGGPFLDFGSVCVFDVYAWASPHTIIGQCGGSGNILKKMDYTATLSNPATPPTITTLPNGDASTCLNIPSTVALTGQLMGNMTDTRFTQAFGGGQDAANVVLILDTVQGCRWLNTNTGQIGGSFGPTGAVVAYDDTGAITAWTNNATIHKVNMDHSGTWTSVGFETPVTIWFWQIDTLNLYHCNYQDFVPVNCGAHGAWLSSGKFWWGWGSATHWTTIQTLPPANNWVTGIGSAQYPAGFDGSEDSHDNTNNEKAGLALPLLVSPFLTTAPTHAWEDELMSVSQNGQTIWRHAHMYTRAHDFNSQGLATISHDGKWALFGSDWGGTTRSDAYLIALPETPSVGTTLTPNTKVTSGVSLK